MKRIMNIRAAKREVENLRTLLNGTWFVFTKVSKQRDIRKAGGTYDIVYRSLEKLMAVLSDLSPSQSPSPQLLGRIYSSKKRLYELHEYLCQNNSKLRKLIDREVQRRKQAKIKRRIQAAKKTRKEKGSRVRIAGTSSVANSSAITFRRATWSNSANANRTSIEIQWMYSSANEALQSPASCVHYHQVQRKNTRCHYIDYRYSGPHYSKRDA